LNSHIVQIPIAIRGELISDFTTEFGGRRGGIKFLAPDTTRYLSQLVLEHPSQMADLYQLSFEDIVSYLVELGQRMSFAKNEHLQQAYEVSRATSGLSESILRYQYEMTPHYFQAEEFRNIARRSVGLEYLEGWVEQPPGLMPGLQARIRAFGARSVHIIAGNTPFVSSLTIIRNAITRSDCIIKAPSNDPLTAVAIARTMIEMAPDHPLTKHVSVAYWKGGNEAVESFIYDPRRIEKIIAWGGFDSVQHVKKYLQPGLDLITLDPKLSGTIIGKEAFENEATLRSVARRLALDIGGNNQEACVSARVVYVESGTDAAGLERANRLGELTFEALKGLPATLSTPHKAFNVELKAEIDGLRVSGDDYCVIGGVSNEGAIIVSQTDAPVDFSRMLACRVGNIVPIDNLETAVRSVNAYTQTIGLFPESLKERLRDRLSYQGAQRLVSLGIAGTMMHSWERQDAIEPVRRMCKWIVEESCDGATIESLAG
jgi:hypothetical protein